MPDVGQDTAGCAIIQRRRIAMSPRIQQPLSQRDILLPGMMADVISRDDELCAALRADGVRATQLGLATGARTE